MHGHKDALVDFANAEVLRDAVIATYAANDHEVIASDANFTRTRYTNARGIRFEFIEHDYVVGLGGRRAADRRRDPGPLLSGQPGSRDHRGRPADGVRLRGAERVHVGRRSDGASSKPTRTARVD